MRTLHRNKQNLYYSLFMGTQPVYKTDDDGNYILKKDGSKINTGEKENIYSDPVPFKSSISFSGGEIQEVEFGIDYSSYDASMILPKDSVPIKELTLVWHTSEVKLIDGKVDPLSADYTVKRKSPSLNYDRYLLTRIVKHEED